MAAVSQDKTPVTQRRSKSKSYQLQEPSCFVSLSRLSSLPALSTRRLSTRRSPRSLNISENVDPAQLALLTKMEWRLAYVTPLYKFTYTQLEKYGKMLTAFIVAEKQRGLAVELGLPQTSFRVSFSVVEGLVDSADDAETVLVQIFSKPPYSKRDDPQKVVWSGWLTCINGIQEYLRTLSADFTCLPLFCSSGAAGLTAAVQAWFQQTFDCCFGPLEINHTCMQWLLALWTDRHHESSIDHLNMVWTLPVKPPLQVTLTVDPEDAYNLWNSVREPTERRESEERSIGIEEVCRFEQDLKGHFFRHFRLDLSAGCLNQVSTALGSAKHTGKIKITNSRYIITTLTLLTEYALLKMPF